MKNFLLSNWSSAFAAVLLIILNCCCSFSSTAALSNSKDLPECVYVKSAYFDEYLYMASDDVALNTNDSRVFTWRRKQDGSAADWGNTWGEEHRYKGVWKLLKQNYCDNCYLARSAYHLATSTNAPRHIVVEPVPGSADRHRIMVYDAGEDACIYASPDFDQENSKSVFNVLHQLRITVHFGDQSQQYVISPIPDSNISHRRNVFFWSPREQGKIDTMGELRDWIIEKAECPPVGLVGSKQIESSSLVEINSASVPQSHSKCVCLKNVLYEEFLYAETPILGYKDYLSVFTWGHKTDDPRNWGKTKGIENKYQAVFQLEKNNSTCQDCLTIKSVIYKDAGSLFSYTESGPARFVAIYGRKIQFPTDLGQNIWEIETIPGTSNYIRLKNKNPGEENIQYMSAGNDGQKHDNIRRDVYVISERENSKIDNWNGAADWIMLDVECPSFIV